MSKNKPVKSRTIWISLLTSVSYLAIVGGAISTSPVISQNVSRQDIAQAEEQTATPEQTEAESNTEKPSVKEPPAEADNTLEKAIIAELNRVRTNPQGYAEWLESQKQYYQGMLLKLPGEQPIRTNRGLRSLEEAITFLRQQQQLPALSPSTKLTSTARQQITAITNNQQVNRNNLVYGKVTPEAIVMQLVVDDGFPDRPHRLAIFNRNHQNTGIACSEIPVYNQVCAIAYTETNETVSQPAEDNTGESATENNNQLPTPPETEDNTTNPQPEVIVTTKPASETNAPEIVDNQTTPTKDSELEIPTDTDNATSSEETVVTTETNNNQTTPTIESESEVANTTESPSVESVTTESTPETPTENSEEEVIATTEIETNSDVDNSNTNSPSQAVEIVERGTLEEGDDVIPNDGSFYDSYPIEGSAGDSFTITLESQDFDTFLAIMDRDGNIIEQNDDVNEQDSNSRLEITLPNNGTYSVIVNAYEQQGQGNYVLTVRR